MKTLMMMVAATTGFLALAGCGGTSPAVTVTCTASQSPNVSGVGIGFFKIVQAVSFTDPGTTGGSPSPLSNVKIRIVSPFPDNAAVCAGTCTAAGTFSSDTKVETDRNGILIFTVRLTSIGKAVNGSLIEVADSQAADSCNVPFTVS